MLRRVPHEDAAQRERFLGSPTVRVDSRDVEPGAEERDDFGLKCRLYRVPSGLRGAPLDEWVLDALAREDMSPQAQSRFGHADSIAPLPLKIRRRTWPRLLPDPLFALTSPFPDPR